MQPIDDGDDRRKIAEGLLIQRLRAAHSGELAAALAYRGHHRSLGSKEEQRSRIEKIEEEEWHHRRQVAGMIAKLGAEIDHRLERRARLIGTVLGALCHLGGWFAPMYGAGRLEKRNVREYEEAADLALESGHPEFIEALLTMAEIEWDHEKYFADHVRNHFLARLVPLWDSPPPRADIRAGHARRSESGSRPAPG